MRITESIESDMLSHDRHASIKLWGLDHSSLFDYGVRARQHERELTWLHALDCMRVWYMYAKYYSYSY